MFNVVSRIYDPTGGRLTFDGMDLLEVPAHGIAGPGIARTFQNLALFPSMTLLQNTMVGRTPPRQGRLHPGDAAASGWAGRRTGVAADAPATSRSLELRDLVFRPAAGLPFGTLKRLELARALASHPRLLLLDEPAAGLTHSEVDELGDTIQQGPRRVRAHRLLVEHHMGMVMGISDGSWPWSSVARSPRASRPKCRATRWSSRPTSGRCETIRIPARAASIWDGIHDVTC